MKKIVCLLIIIEFFSCHETIKNKKILARHQVVYDFDSIPQISNYRLTITEMDSFIRYEYQNLVDSTKKMNLHFVKNSGKIHLGPWEFYLKEKNIIQNKFNFDRYEMESMADGFGPLYFNQDYGILGFINGLGMQIHYLSHENKKQFDLPLFFRIENFE